MWPLEDRLIQEEHAENQKCYTNAAVGQRRGQLSAHTQNSCEQLFCISLQVSYIHSLIEVTAKMYTYIQNKNNGLFYCLTCILQSSVPNRPRNFVSVQSQFNIEIPFSSKHVSDLNLCSYICQFSSCSCMFSFIEVKALLSFLP